MFFCLRRIVWIWPDQSGAPLHCVVTPSQKSCVIGAGFNRSENRLPIKERRRNCRCLGCPPLEGAATACSFVLFFFSNVWPPLSTHFVDNSVNASKGWMFINYQATCPLVISAFRVAFFIQTLKTNPPTEVTRGCCPYERQSPLAAFISGGVQRRSEARRAAFDQGRLFCRLCAQRDNRNWLSQGSVLIPEDAQKLELSGPGSTPCRDKLEGTRSQTGPCLFTRSELPAQTSPSASHVPKQAVKSRLQAAGSSS